MACKVNVAGLDGPLCTVLVDGTSLAALFAAISVATGIEPESQRLLHGSRELRSDADCDACFNNGSAEQELTLVRRTEEQKQWLAAVETSGGCTRWMTEGSPSARGDVEAVRAMVGMHGHALEFAAP